MLEIFTTWPFEDIRGSGTNLHLTDDSVAAVAIPFDFNFYCGTYNSVHVSSNGTLSFTSSSANFGNTNIPTNRFPDLLAVVWDDLYPPRGDGVYWQVLGTSPYRRLVVQWNDIPHISSTGNATFQVILYEGTDNILYQYKDVDFGDPIFNGGATATVGIQQDETKGIEYSFNTPSLSNGLAILFTRKVIMSPINYLLLD